MSLNYKEIGLILSEADLENSKIQSVVQNSFHSLTWNLYRPDRRAFSFYSEVGTNESRIHLLSSEVKLAKTKKLQRFEQFARKNLEGSVILSCRQVENERIVIMNLDNHGRFLKVYIRLWSGPGANIIVTDENDKILDLLLRRPGRDEVSGKVFELDQKPAMPQSFEIRPYQGSFNRFIEQSCTEKSDIELYESLVKQVTKKHERELARLETSLNSTRKTIEVNKDYDEIRKTADLLSANSYLAKRGMESIKIIDYNDNSQTVILLDKRLSPGDNVQAYYDKYQKQKGTYENAVNEEIHFLEEIEKTNTRFEKALLKTDDLASDIRRLKNILEKPEETQQIHEGPGLRASSGGFDILIGRNAKENDALLRHFAKGNDTWLHTRDYPGGYVFIKFKKNKTIPLDVLLDAANLAILFSKAKNNPSVDLYYTQVKYLRRAKDSKLGTVLPTQEKNLTVKFDRTRADRVLGQKEQNSGYTD